MFYQKLTNLGFSSASILFVLLAAVFSSLFIFQNCAAPLAVEGDQQSFSMEPFAFETKLDHIAYMTCSEMGSLGYDNDAYFTFKVGAYSPVNGIGFNSEFQSRIANSRPSEVVGILQNSQANMSAQLQLAVRRRANVYQVFSANAGSPTESEDYENFLTQLSSSAIANELAPLKSGEKVNYFDKGIGLKSPRLEAKLYFNDSEDLQIGLRNDLFNQSSLMVTYVDRSESDPILPIGYSSSARTMSKGSRFDLGFDLGHGIYLNGTVVSDSNLPKFTVGPQKVLASVNEKDLENLSATGASWICPDDLRFVIVRPEDNGDKVFCGINYGASDSGFFENVGSPPPGASQNSYLVARNILPIEHWHIDFQRKCIVPKTNQDSCYGKKIDFTKNPINYNAGSSQAPAKCGVDDTGLYRTCPHYVSICYRSN